MMQQLTEQGDVIPTSPWEMVVSATPVTQAVLVLLVLLSLVSWGIMFAK